MFWIGLMCFFVLFLMGGVLRVCAFHAPDGNVIGMGVKLAFVIVFFAGVCFCAAGIVQAAMVFLQ